MRKRKNNMIKKSNVVKKSWNTPKLIALNVSKTAGGSSSHREGNMNGRVPQPS